MKNTTTSQPTNFFRSAIICMALLSIAMLPVVWALQPQSSPAAVSNVVQVCELTTTQEWVILAGPADPLPTGTGFPWDGTGTNSYAWNG